MDRRKIRALLFLVICLTAFAGCKKKHVGTEEDNAAPRQEEEEQTVYRFGFSCSTKQNSYYETLRESISEELRKEGHILIGNNEDAGMDAGKQIEQIGQMIEQGIDVIFLIPVDWKEITPALEALEEADVKIINLDTQVADLDLTDAYIGTDNKEAGALCGKALIDRYPQGGKIAILECPTINSINDRITGFEEALAGNPFEVVARVDAAGEKEKAKAEAQKIFAENPDVIAVMCGNDQAALGAYEAAKAAGLSDFSIYGVDGLPEIKKELEKGNPLIAGTAAQSPILMGKEAVKTAFAILNKEDYEKEKYLETYLITKENIEMYGSDGWQ